MLQHLGPFLPWRRLCRPGHSPCLVAIRPIADPCDWMIWLKISQGGRNLNGQKTWPRFIGNRTSKSGNKSRSLPPELNYSCCSEDLRVKLTSRSSWKLSILMRICTKKMSTMLHLDIAIRIHSLWTDFKFRPTAKRPIEKEDSSLREGSDKNLGVPSVFIETRPDHETATGFRWTKRSYVTRIYIVSHLHHVSLLHMSNNLLRCVCKAMERIAPIRLAEKWDNVRLELSIWNINLLTLSPSQVGLLLGETSIFPLSAVVRLTTILESPVQKQGRKRIMLTIEYIPSFLTEQFNFI